MTHDHRNDAHWYPVLRVKKLGKKPVRVMVNNVALVVFRTRDGIACLRDMCPHRCASLSKGKVVDDDIACPYHGWQFNDQGQCTKIPLHEGELPNRRVAKYDVCESHGLIFVTRDARIAAPLVLPTWDGQPKVQKILQSRAICTLADAVENVLDPIHTMFVHKGLIRGAGGDTNRVRITVAIENDALVMRFSGEENQNGILSKLLEGERSHAIGRFRMPGVVDLEYWGPERLNLVTTLYFTPEREHQYRGFAIMTGPRQKGFGVLKSLVFLPLMRKVIAQDLAIMEDATSNWDAAGRPKYAQSDLDILRPFIEAVIDATGADMAPKEISLDL